MIFLRIDPPAQSRAFEEASKKKGFIGGGFYSNPWPSCEVAQRAVKSSAIDGARCLDELGKKSCPKIRSEREVRASSVLGDGEGNVP